jgi:beta-phosphoglucomutase-like phosphatase (HAD superfamily)
MEGNLRELGLTECAFDTVITACDVQHTKPAPDIFLSACTKLELPGPACLVVEDAINGIKAGKAADCRCLGIATSFPDEDLVAAGAEWTAPHLALVPDALTNLLFA